MGQQDATPPAPPRSVDSPQRVVVVDVEMRFFSMVVFMVKAALAAIPALIILAVLFVGAALVLSIGRQAYVDYQKRQVYEQWASQQAPPEADRPKPPVNGAEVVAQVRALIAEKKWRDAYWTAKLTLETKTVEHDDYVALEKLRDEAYREFSATNP